MGVLFSMARVDARVDADLSSDQNCSAGYDSSPDHSSLSCAEQHQQSSEADPAEPHRAAIK